MTAAQIRTTFLEFFKAKKHTIVSSAPLVVKGDSTLMFVNSGMAPFKDYFLGNTEPKYRRIADTQKCLRVSGKHNDLEDVGHDTYHHTLFEMLGNWSFGDYFKQEAIEWAWELLTKEYGIDKDRLYVSVFAGDSKDGLGKDEEAYNFWIKLIDSNRIINGSKKDNFWEMGETGPCGPCSEIHVDLRPDAERKLVDGKVLVNQDHPQVIEIWNIVFMQYERMANGSLRELKSKHIDTGMGFERLVRALQHKTSNYDTDVFQPLIQLTAEKAKVVYGTDEKIDIALRVIADHIRAIAFTIADGQLPSNTGAGYVIRRIIRRAVRYGYTFLDFKDPFLYELCQPLAEQFSTVFPELNTQLSFVQKVIQEEEQGFLRTLATGIQKFDKYLEAKPILIEGNFAFELFDTYGFPIDLTSLLAKENNLEVEMDAFNALLKLQKDRSRKATAVSTDDWQVLKAAEQRFIGYDTLSIDSAIIKYRVVQQKGKTVYQLMPEVSPFYPEGGGQVGDRGMLIDSSGNQIEVIDTIKENNEILLITNVLPLNLTGESRLVVNLDSRSATAKNHTATHLLHAALSSVLGNHVEQKGSLVNPDYLRFDFAHFNKMSVEELAKVEAIVNQKIIEAIPLVEQRNVPYQQAIAEGVTALFGEKYGDFVRVITFDNNFSKELCGGTHSNNTLAIRLFKIVSEGAVAAGVRRIEAITDLVALDYYHQLELTLQQIQVKFKNPQNILKAIESQQEEINRLQSNLEVFQTEKAQQLKTEIRSNLTEKGGYKVAYIQTNFQAQEAIKGICFELTQELSDIILVIVQTYDISPLFTVAMSKPLVENHRFNAITVIKNITSIAGGGGGGQPFFANGKGKSAEKLAEIKSKILDTSLLV